MLTLKSIVLWFICMVFIYNTIFWKQIQHFTYIVAGQSSHTYKPQQYTHPSQHVNVNQLYIFTEHMYQWPLYQFLIFLMMGACARNMQRDPAEIKPAQCCTKLVFHLNLTYIRDGYSHIRLRIQFGSTFQEHDFQ